MPVGESETQVVTFGVLALAPNACSHAPGMRATARA